jgi:preprotein translocase subunit SecG
MIDTDIIVIAFFTGFFGDILLQIGAKTGMGGTTGWGLNDYFKQHGAAESICIAGGMMAFFYAIYILLNLPVNFICLAIYGIALDLIFRETMIFSSLTGYYKYFGYFWSAVWGAIPLMLPLFISNMFNV